MEKERAVVFTMVLRSCTHAQCMCVFCECTLGSAYWHPRAQVYARTYSGTCWRRCLLDYVPAYALISICSHIDTLRLCFLLSLAAAPSSLLSQSLFNLLLLSLLTFLSVFFRFQSLSSPFFLSAFFIFSFFYFSWSWHVSVQEDRIRPLINITQYAIRGK